MRPVRARTCVCCETVPQEQLGDPTRFLNGREVMEEVRRWRAAHPRAPLASAMCFPNDVIDPEGRRCRREGGEVCQEEANPCLM